MSSGGIVDATIITMDSRGAIIRDGGVLWEDSRITAVGSSGEIKKLAEEKNIVPESAENAVVFPGLVNTHTHLFQNLLKGLGADLNLENWWPSTIKPAAVNLQAQHVQAAAAGGMLESVRSGTTTILDYNYALPSTGLSDCVIEKAARMGIRMVYARGFRNTGAEHGFPVQLIEKTEDVFEDVLRLRRLYEKEDDMIKIWVAPAAIWALDGAGLKDTRSFADSSGVPVTMHMYETDTDNVVCRERYGAPDALSYFLEAGFLGSDLMAVHVVAAGERELNAFREYGVKVSHNPVANMYLASGVAPVPEMLERGIQVGLGTDGAASNNTLDMLETLKQTALLQKVSRRDPTSLSAYDVLHMATMGGAKVLGLEELIGSLEKGKKADLFVFNPGLHGKSCPWHDPVATLVYSSGQDAVEKVVIDGKTVLDEGIFVQVDEKSIYEQQQKMALDLVKRAGYPADFLNGCID